MALLFKVKYGSGPSVLFLMQIILGRTFRTETHIKYIACLRTIDAVNMSF